MRPPDPSEELEEEEEEEEEEELYKTQTNGISDGDVTHTTLITVFIFIFRVFNRIRAAGGSGSLHVSSHAAAQTGRVFVNRRLSGAGRERAAVSSS